MKNMKIVQNEIINYLRNHKEASVGEMYMNFHLMHKSEKDLNPSKEEITAAEIVENINTLSKLGIITYDVENNEKVYSLKEE